MSPRLSLEEQRARIVREAPPEAVAHELPPVRQGLRPLRRPAPPGVASRLTEGRRRAVASGKKGSGPAPYGYRWSRGELRVVEAEAATVRRIFSLYLERGASVKSVVGALAGTPPRRARAWSRACVAYVLKNRTYAGFVAWGDVSGAGLHEPIVASIVFNKAGVKLRANDKRGAK